VRKFFGLAVIGQSFEALGGQVFLTLVVAEAASPGHAQANVHGWTDTTPEDFHVENPLPIGNGHDVGWQVGRDIAVSGVHDRYARQALAATIEPTGSFE